MRSILKILVLVATIVISARVYAAETTVANLSALNIGGSNKGTVFATTTVSVTGPTTVGCTDTTVAVASATIAMTVLVSPQTNPNGSTFGFSWSGYVSSAGNIAVRVCNTVIDTSPPATTFNVVVLN